MRKTISFWKNTNPVHAANSFSRLNLEKLFGDMRADVLALHQVAELARDLSAAMRVGATSEQFVALATRYAPNAIGTRHPRPRVVAAIQTAMDIAIAEAAP